MASLASPILSVSHLNKTFASRRKDGARVQAVTDVSFDVMPGQTLAIVGESGCGKSTVARLLTQLIEADSGEVAIGGEPASAKSRKARRSLHQSIQMVFQDSHASLNPRKSVEEAITFGLHARGVRKGDARVRAELVLAEVGLSPERFAHRLPHELSGGQRQRVNIARALALEPKIIVMDEPLAALDKSIEAQIVNLLCDLRDRNGLTFVLISHDLNVVRYIADRVLVMYLGKVAELGPTEDVFTSPVHPYTRALIASAPTRDPARRTMAAPIEGDPPTPLNPPSGCRFHTRCPLAMDICFKRDPEFHGLGAGHSVACHLAADQGSERA